MRSRATSRSVANKNEILTLMNNCQFRPCAEDLQSATLTTVHQERLIEVGVRFINLSTTQGDTQRLSNVQRVRYRSTSSTLISALT